MLINRKTLRLGAAAGVLAWAAAGAAFAQSTASTTVQDIVITATNTGNVGGVVTQQEAPKTREIVSQAFIASQPAGANAISDLRLIPGITFSQDDPYGNSGSAGHLSIRGIKGANIGEMVDGVPLNDSGNYAIYPGELIDPEIISNVNVITGSSDVDAPSSSSLGGLVNINSLTPTDNFGGFLNGSLGSFQYWRIAGLINTGEFGPWGTKAWIEASDQRNNKFTHVGMDEKYQVNAKIYQDLHHDGDFIAIAGFYDRQLLDFYDGVNFASTGATTGSTYHPPTPVGNFHGLLSTPWNNDYLPTFTPPSSTSTNSSFQGVEENPTWTGNLRGESRFTLAPNLKLTIDPSFQWVLANGEGSTVISDTDKRLIGVGVTQSKSNLPACYTNGVVSGIDLDLAQTATGAPYCGDSVRLLSPSNTQTHRYTLNASLIWDFLPGQLLQLSYAYDHGHVRQTGEYGLLDASGEPYSVFGGLKDFGTPVLAADGSTLEKRNRVTVALLNQGSAEYIGKFFDDKLRLDLGVRAPFLSRDLNQLCYTQPASNVYCTNYASVANAAGYLVSPFTLHTHYDKALPNVGATWSFDGHNQVFADYTEAMNAPVNDDLYSIGLIGTGGTTTTTPGADNVQPETSNTIEAGYRYQSPTLKATFDVYRLNDNNHIVSAFNQLTQDSVDTNVGAIHFYGAEALVGWEPIHNLNLIGSLAYEHSRVLDNIPYSTTYSIPTAGKQFYDTPQWTAGGHVTYDWNIVTIGGDFNYVSSRYVTSANDLQVPSYIVFNTDIRVKLDWLHVGSFLQLNVTNLLNEKYIGSINYANTNNNTSPAYTYSYAYQGAPRTVQVSLRTAF